MMVCWFLTVPDPSPLSRHLYLVTLISSLLLAAAVASPAAAQGWKPPRPVELIVGSGAGGAADRQARVVQKYLQTFPGIPGVVINNRPGGAGNLAYAYLAQHPGESGHRPQGRAEFVGDRVGEHLEVTAGTLEPVVGPT